MVGSPRIIWTFLECMDVFISLLWKLSLIHFNNTIYCKVTFVFVIDAGHFHDLLGRLILLSLTSSFNVTLTISAIFTSWSVGKWWIWGLAKRKFIAHTPSIFLANIDLHHWSKKVVSGTGNTFQLMSIGTLSLWKALSFLQRAVILVPYVTYCQPAPADGVFRQCLYLE